MTDSDERAQAEQIERSLASKASVGLPAVTVVGAVGVGIGFGVGPAILVLAAGALVSVIGLLWASLRTLGGDAPLAAGLVAAGTEREGVSRLADKKRQVLRALKDLELEHSLGKIDDDDYAEISANYRAQAKGLLREMDVEIEPFRSKAEALARTHLERRGLARAKTAGGDIGAPPSATPDAPPSAKMSRVACSGCGASNDADAIFCKRCRARLSRLACPSCSASNEPDAEFCKKCGASLGNARSETSTPEAEAKDA